jgi:hypothetical protein
MATAALRVTCLLYLARSARSVVCMSSQGRVFAHVQDLGAAFGSAVFHAERATLAHTAGRTRAPCVARPDRIRGAICHPLAAAHGSHARSQQHRHRHRGAICGAKPSTVAAGDHFAVSNAKPSPVGAGEYTANLRSQRRAHNDGSLSAGRRARAVSHCRARS